MTPNSFALPNIDSIAALLPAFEIDCLIAQGGMGVVYKARQRSLDRDVAIKILPHQLGEDPLFRSSFQAEARSMARLTHPNLIRVYDSGDLDGLLYIVMEYVPGKSLFHSAHRKAIDSRQAVEIVIAACRGLAHAHENGIVHRDIKPANILLTPKCEPKIGDFGLARCIRTGVDGLAMGTPSYMAPEVFAHPEKGNPQSDVFAIGVVLQEMLTGIPPGTDQAELSVVSDPMLAAICRKATHADPASRYLDAASLADQLARWMAPAKTPRALVPVRRIHNPRPKPCRVARHGAAASKSSPVKSFTVVAILALVSCLGWGLYQKVREVIARQQLEQKARPSMQMAKAD
ncbi:MAG: serine/threonine-protein kinase [Luteolibacter sp.]